MPPSTSTITTTSTRDLVADGINIVSALIAAKDADLAPPDTVKFPTCDIVVPLATEKPVVSPNGKQAVNVLVGYKVTKEVYQWSVKFKGETDAMGTVKLARNTATNNLRLSDKSAKLLILDTLEKSIRDGGRTLLIDIGSEASLNVPSARMAGANTIVKARELVFKRVLGDGKEERVSGTWKYLCEIGGCGRFFEEGSYCSAKHRT
ncbi:hypothetical protein C8F01DRAFT_1106068 [Mycena amicta]|nr:hypothetical protein C8F01DRAFT_1106068 [Mycena amicta]